MGNRFSSPEPLGTEAAAKVHFSSDQITDQTVLGVIVKKNDNFLQFIDPKRSYMAKLKYVSYFVYITDKECQNQNTVEIALIEPTSTAKQPITCKVDDLQSGEKIASVAHNHYFIPCESIDFNKNSFLRKHSKEVKASSAAAGSFEGDNIQLFCLQMANNDVDLVLLPIKRTNNNVLVVDDEVFDKVNDGAVLDKNKSNLVGHLHKNSESNVIEIQSFWIEELKKVWKKSTIENVSSASSIRPNLETDGSRGNRCEKNNDVQGSEIDACGRLVLANYDNGDEIGDIESGEDLQMQSSGSSKRSDPDTGGSSCSINEEIIDQGSEIDACGRPVQENGNNGNQVKQVPERYDDVGDVECSDGDDKRAEESGGSRSSPDHNDDLSGENHEDNKEEDSALSVNYRAISSRSAPGPVERQESDISKHSEKRNSCFVVNLDDPKESKKEVTFCELYEYNSSIMLDLSLEFDKKSHTIQPLLTLADKLEAPPLVKEKCRSNYNHSPTALVLDIPKVAAHKITKLVSVLMGMEKKKIALLIQAKMEEEEKTIEDFFCAHYDLKEEVTTKLEAEDDYSWRLLGKKFGVEDHVLDNVERGTNPVENFLVDHAYRAVQREKLQICRFRADMERLGRKDEVDNLFERLNITPDDDSKALYEVFKPHNEKMEELCKLLNKTDTCKGWLHLAALWEVDELEYFYYIPDTKASATRILFNWLMMQKEEFTVDELLSILRGMKRERAHERLKKKKDEYLKVCESNDRSKSSASSN